MNETERRIQALIDENMVLKASLAKLRNDYAWLEQQHVEVLEMKLNESDEEGDE